MKNFLLFLLFTLLTSVWATAQNPIGNINLEQEYTGMDQQDLAQMPEGDKIGLPAIFKAKLTVSPGQDVEKIAIKMGLSEGGSDFFYKEFDYGSPGTFADGTAYQASGNHVTLTLGEFGGYGLYHVEARAILEDGSSTAPVRTVLE